MAVTTPYSELEGVVRLKVRRDAVVRLEYVLRVDGEVVDETPEGEPVAVLHGRASGLPPGLESVLEGRGVGPFEARVPPELGAGERDPGLVLIASREDFPPGAVLEAGEEFYFEGEGGEVRPARIVAVEGDRVRVDANPALAGKVLEYTGIIHEVREATPEELEHGHAHGEGGVHH